MTKKEKPNDLYGLKRQILKKKREVRNKILGTDTVDGSSMQRFYSEATKTKRALKIEFFGSKSKASATEGEETSIEKFVREILEAAEIPFKEQKSIRFINVDFFLPEHSTVVQVHGDYWHCHPKLYPEPKNNIQRKNIEKDKVANEIIKGAEFHLIEVWEDDIKHRPELVKTKLLEVIDGTKQATALLFVCSSDW
jgi:G:T-mismatch repair DNA endonuclease (very short patch repair protein)